MIEPETKLYIKSFGYYTTYVGGNSTLSMTITIKNHKVTAVGLVDSNGSDWKLKSVDYYRAYADAGEFLSKVIAQEAEEASRG